MYIFVALYVIIRHYYYYYYIINIIIIIINYYYHLPGGLEKGKFFLFQVWSLPFLFSSETFDHFTADGHFLPVKVNRKKSRLTLFTIYG